MFEEERLQKINQIVQNNARASVRRLCELLDVSESTVRRDLTELERRQLIKRTRGGAIRMESVGFEPTYGEKTDQQREEKQRIAERAAALVQDGDSLLIDSGTTTLYLAMHLAKRRRLTVVTNSIHLMQQLSGAPEITLVSTGGVLRPNTMALVGPVAEGMLANLRVDKAFIAVNGIDKEMGLTTPNITEASIKRKMMQVADQVYVLADHSKIGRVSFAKFGGVEEIDGCITSNEVGNMQAEEFASRGVRLYFAEMQETPA